jgi:hypothetical protein
VGGEERRGEETTIALMGLRAGRVGLSERGSLRRRGGLVHEGRETRKA